MKVTKYRKSKDITRLGPQILERMVEKAELHLGTV